MKSLVTDLIEMRSMQPTCLLVRPHPIKEESWGGFLLRLSNANGYQGISDLAVILGIHAENHSKVKREISILNATPKTVLTRLGIQWQSVLIGTGSSQAVRGKGSKLSFLGRSRTFKVCPSCLMSDMEPYIRSNWEGPISFTCQKHDVALISECQKCAKPLTYHQRSHTQCECGEHYKDHVPLPVLDWMKDLQRVFAEAIPKKPKSTFAGITQLERDASTSINWLVEPLDSKIGRRICPPNRKPKSLTPNDIQRLAPLLRNWPHHASDSIKMELEIDGFRRGSYFSRRLVVSSFKEMGRLAKTVYLNLKLEPLIWLEANGDTLINPRKSGFTLKDLQKLTGIPPGLLTSLCQSWRLIEARPDGSNDTWHPSVEVSARIYWSVFQMYRETNDVKCAASQVGCSEDAIRGLIKSGAIKSFALSSKMKDRRTYPEELAKLAKYLFEVAKFKESVFCPDDVCFSDWAKTMFSHLTAGRWKRILEAIQKGRVTVFTSVPQPISLDQLYVTRQDQLRILDQRHILD